MLLNDTRIVWEWLPVPVDLTRRFSLQFLIFTVAPRILKFIQSTHQQMHYLLNL